MESTIKQRISWSFSLLVLLFFINAIITIVSLHKSRVSTERISNVLDPSIKILYEFKDVLLESRTYSINWVFLRSQSVDKEALMNINNKKYPELKSKLTLLSASWKKQNMKDSLAKFYTDFDQLIDKEQSITVLLANFSDYDNLVKRLEAEQLLEDEVLPRSKSLLILLQNINEYEQAIRSEENNRIEHLSNLLTIIICVTSFLTVLAAFFLSAYLRKIILQPINKIKDIVLELGKGVTGRVSYTDSNNEIAVMVAAVNQLSEKLESTAKFADEIGKRNFDAVFEPLSCGDTLGIALLTMRDNLKASDEKLNEAQHIAHLASWEFNLVNEQVNLSDEFYNILEIEHADFDHTLEGYLAYIHPDDKQNLLDRVKKIAEDHQPYSSEYRVITKNNNIKTLFSQRDLDLDEHGKMTRLFGTVLDITEQKKTRLALEKAHNELATLFNNIDEVFFSVDMEDYKIIQISPACEKVYGYSQAEFYERPNLWRDVITKEDKEVVVRNNQTLMLTGKPFTNITHIHHKDGSIRCVETKVIPTLNNLGKLIRLDGVTTDITVRKEAEEALISNNIELKKTNTELDKFVYSVSHDLRAPLTSMLGVVEISEEDTQDPAILNHLSMLKRSIHKLDGFIVDILDYSRNSRTEVIKEEIHIDEMLDDITKNLKFMGGNNRIVDINIIVNNGIPFVSDKSRISVLLNNLISNAIRYQNPLMEKPFVDIKVNVNNDEANIIITDNGIGIGKEYQQKVFDMFYRVSEGSIGSGLGLYIVKETIDKLHGHIELDSELGKGTTFKITIPNN